MEALKNRPCEVAKAKEPTGVADGVSEPAGQKAVGDLQPWIRYSKAPVPTGHAKPASEHAPTDHLSGSSTTVTNGEPMALKLPAEPLPPAHRRRCSLQKPANSTTSTSTQSYRQVGMIFCVVPSGHTPQDVAPSTSLNVPPLQFRLSPSKQDVPGKH